MPTRAKEQILRCATKTFAHKGYHRATIAEICQAAHTNIASVNYHFGSKENLFRHALRHAFHTANQRFPIDGKLGTDASPQERLYCFIEALIRRTFVKGPAGYFNRIMGFEARNETPLHKLILEEVSTLEINYLDSIIAALLDHPPTTLLHQGRCNILSLAALFVIIPNSKKMIFGGAPSSEQLDQFIQQQVQFAQQGLDSLTQAPCYTA